MWTTNIDINSGLKRVSDAMVVLGKRLEETGAEGERLFAELDRSIAGQVAKLDSNQRARYYALVDGGMGKIDALVIVAPND